MKIEFQLNAKCIVEDAIRIPTPKEIEATIEELLDTYMGINAMVTVSGFCEKEADHED